MAKPHRPTIGLLFVGGSTLDGRDRDTTTVLKPQDVKPWLANITEADIIGETVGWFISSGEQPIGATEWSLTAKTIYDRYDEVDGFVVVHSLELLPAAATALHQMLGAIGKPVVVVGSPLPAPHERKHETSQTWPTTKEYGAKASFINAIQVAISDVGEVVVVYGSHIFRGSTVCRIVEGERSRFEGKTLGKIDFGIRMFDEQTHRGRRPIKIFPEMESRVVAVEFLPGMSVDHILHMADGVKGVFLSAHETWGLLQTALPEIVRRTACPIGVYAPGQRVVPAGLLVPGVSRTNALITFMWALGQTSTPAQLKKKLGSIA